MHRYVAALSVVLLLAGCGSPQAEGAPVPSQPSAPTASPMPAPSNSAAPADEARFRFRISSTEIPPAEAAVPPVRVRVPAVEVDVEVVPVGVRPDGLMELPDYVGTAGWYRFGAEPASGEGTTVIAAHVDSLRWGLGPFARLKELPAGAEIVVLTADGQEHRYAVESVTNVLKEELPVQSIFSREGPERLALITCGGRFDRDALRYSDNVLVTAVPVL